MSSQPDLDTGPITLDAISEAAGALRGVVMRTAPGMRAGRSQPLALSKGEWSHYFKSRHAKFFGFSRTGWNVRYAP